MNAQVVREQIERHSKALRNASSTGGLNGAECHTLAEALDKLVADEAVKEKPAADEKPASSGFDITSVTVDEAKAKIAKADTATLDAFEKQEKAGKDRVGVHEAIDARREELEAVEV